VEAQKESSRTCLWPAGEKRETGGGVRAVCDERALGRGGKMRPMGKVRWRAWFPREGGPQRSWTGIGDAEKVKGYRTRKTRLLVNVPSGVTTLTWPVVAPVGTVVVISDGETTWNVAEV
jgi:hypothetical protein